MKRHRESVSVLINLYEDFKIGKYVARLAMGILIK